MIPPDIPPSMSLFSQRRRQAAADARRRTRLDTDRVAVGEGPRREFDSRFECTGVCGSGWVMGFGMDLGQLGVLVCFLSDDLAFLCVLCFALEDLIHLFWISRCMFVRRFLFLPIPIPLAQLYLPALLLILDTVFCLISSPRPLPPPRVRPCITARSAPTIRHWSLSAAMVS
jgi:hypothetical protein